MNKRKNFLIVFSFLLGLVSLVSFNGCETSRTGPEVRLTPPTVATQPLLLSVTVINSKTGGGVPGALVELYKADGTKLSIVPTQSGSTYTYNIDNVNSSTIKVVATATNYGYAFYNAKVDLVNRQVEIVEIQLDPIVLTAVTLTPTGGTASVPSTETKAPQPNVTVTVPAGAVTQNTTISVGSLTVNNVPQPPSPTTSALSAVVTLQPAGITFPPDKPITLTFPLPYLAEAGDKLQLMELVNNAWVATVLYATVDNTGLLATVQVNKTSQYALLDESVLTGSASGAKADNGEFVSGVLSKGNEILEEREFLIANSTSPTIITLAPVTFTSTLTYQGLAGGQPYYSLTWLKNKVKRNYGNQFDKYLLQINDFGTQSFNSNQRFSIPYPGFPDDQKQRLNPKNESGDYNVYVKFTSTANAQLVTLDDVLVKQGRKKFQVDFTLTANPWWTRVAGYIYEFKPHNQGAIR